MDADTWTPDDTGATVLIDGAGPNGSQLRAMIGLRNDNGGNFDKRWVNLFFYRGYDNRHFLTSDQVGATNLTQPGHTILVGGFQYRQDDIHLCAMGENLLFPYNAAAGLLEIV